MNSIELSYNFYDDYIQYNRFNENLKSRIQAIRKRYSINKKILDKDFIEEYFVEIFSWSVFPKIVLEHIDFYLKEYNISGIIDPCCGNAFHTYLFSNILKLNTYTVDIQNENNSWITIHEEDGRIFLKSLNNKEHKLNALLLSWIDYESLTIELLNLYKGNLIISLGNYDKLSQNYLKLLNDKFKKIFQNILKMPWGLNENVELYIKKN